MSYSCKHCGLSFEKKQKLGGHARTCKLNPRYEQNLLQLENARAKISREDHPFIKCGLCGKSYSPSGMNIHVWKIHGEGQNIDPNAGYKTGTRQIWNKGLSRSDPRVAKYSQTLSTNRKGKSRPDLRKRLNLNELKDYRYACSFKFSLSDFPQEFDFSLIEKHGWYAPKNRGDNLGGVSRDHIVSIRFGFDNKIEPEIISHPANCRLVVHNDNVSKGTSCGMSLSELLEKIKMWDKKYNSSPPEFVL